MISEGEIYDTVELSRTPLESIYVQHFYKVKSVLVCIRPSVVYEVMMLLQQKSLISHLTSATQIRKTYTNEIQAMLHYSLAGFPKYMQSTYSVGTKFAIKEYDHKD